MEVVVALLISCVMVTSVFTVAVSSKSSSGIADRRLIAAETIREVSSQLHGYVTGCNCNPSNGNCRNAPGTPGDCSVIKGPNTARTGVATWYFNAPGAGVTDSQGDVWALRNGTHRIGGVPGLLPSWFTAAPYNATLTYNVTQGQSVNGRTIQQARVHVDWTEP